MNISLNSTVPFNQIVDASMGEAAKAAGVNLVQFTNQGQVSQWQQGMESAISQKADAIVLEGSPDPKLLGPQIAAAKAAGIPVISTHLYDESYIEDAKKDQPDIAAFVDAHHYRAGTLMADYAIVDSGGTGQRATSSPPTRYSPPQASPRRSRTSSPPAAPTPARRRS